MTFVFQRRRSRLVPTGVFYQVWVDEPGYRPTLVGWTWRDTLGDWCYSTSGAGGPGNGVRRSRGLAAWALAAAAGCLRRPGPARKRPTRTRQAPRKRSA